MSTGIGIGISSNVFQTRAGLASGGGGSSLLLDLYGSDVLGAYSLRKLSSGYAGSAVRVRRTSDNTEQDIGFDASSNLDTSTLTTFLGGSDGFITKWYDQSGNSRDGSQTNASKQFIIATAGVIETKNGLPTTRGGQNKHVDISGFPTTSQPITTFDVYAHSSAGGAGTDSTFVSKVSTANFIRTDYRRFVRVGVLSAFGGTSINVQGNTAHGNTNLHVVTRMLNGASSIVRLDQVAETTQGGGDWVVTGAQMGPADTSIGTNSTSTYYGQLSEIIIFGADKTSDFTGIEEDMKTYYSTP
tara:strand:- start:115 stop:1014 length:900 start_codon:yes stop_codon:yes gene_type:complete